MKQLTGLSLLILCFFCAAAQPKRGKARLDSLLGARPEIKEDTNGVKLMNGLADAYSLASITESEKWSGRALSLAQKLAWPSGEAMAQNNLGNGRYHRGDYAAAMQAYLAALKIGESIGDKRLIWPALSGMGMVYWSRNELTNALRYQYKALTIAEQLHDKAALEWVENNIGCVYTDQNRFGESLTHFLRTLALAQEIDDQDGVACANFNIGCLYQNQKQYSLALSYELSALAVAARCGNKANLVYDLGGIGELYYLIATDSTAAAPAGLVAADRAATILKSIGFLERGIDSALRISTLAPVPEFLDYLSKAQASRGDYVEALATIRKSMVFKDSIYSSNSSQKIAALESGRARELSDKDAQIAALKKRNERIIVAAGFAVLLVVMILILYNYRRHERSRKRIRELQDHKIHQLDEAVKRRTEQLGSMRQTIATDFHDQTGNMLAAITRQAATLELKLLHKPEVLPVVRSIIHNANELYASSKDFLWNLNHDSDDPLLLFQYLSGYGQRYYNQFDIAFSSVVNGGAPSPLQLPPFAGLNLIYIFKEAMSNVVKHSGADEVRMELHWEATRVVYLLQDNGTWKEADVTVEHYGLRNMERRCRQSGFGYELSQGSTGTRIAIRLPLSIDYTHESGRTAEAHPAPDSDRSSRRSTRS